MMHVVLCSNLIRKWFLLIVSGMTMPSLFRKRIVKWVCYCYCYAFQLNPAPQPVKTDRKGRANFGVFTLTAKRSETMQLRLLMSANTSMT